MVKIGILGAGFIAGIHYSAYCKLKNAEVTAITDIDTNRAEKLIKSENIGGNIQTESTGSTSFDPSKIKIYTTIDDLINDKNVEMVDICLPTYLHKDAVIKSANANKSILCEKPIALNIKDAQEMVKIVRKNKVKFMVAHVIRFWPEYVVLKDIVNNKTLSKLLSLNCIRLSPTPTWTWNNWILDNTKSLSSTVDLHIHDTDFILYLCGKPKKVFSQGIKKVTSGIDHIITEYQYRKGFVCYSEGGWAFPEKFPFRMSFIAMFEKGTVEYNSLNQPLTIYENGKEPVKPNLSESDGYQREIDYFLKCIETNKQPKIVTPEDAILSLKITLAELKSAITGKTVLI